MNLCKDFEQGKALITEMKIENLKPDVITYTTLMNLCKDFEQGKALITEMKIENLKPNVITYNTLLEKVETEEDSIWWIMDFCSTNLIPNAYSTSGLKKIFPILYNSSRLMEIFAIMLRFNLLMFFSWLRNFEITEINKFIAHYPEEATDSDYNKLGFANYYLSKEELNSAKKLLDSVTIRNYPFFKYSGNYWFQVMDYEKAEENYKNALPLSENNAHRAEICNNLATIIKDFKINSKIDDAIKYCRQSISYFPDNSPIAKQLLIFFTFEFSTIEQIPQKLRELKLDFNIGKWTIKKVLPEISNEKKIELIKKLLK